MRNRYLDFLCNLVGGKEDHILLLQHLHGVEFYSLVPNDDNRGVDGEQLRVRFEDEVGPQGSSSLPNGPCTVLEMLIGLAYRLEFELLGGSFERPMKDWFWVLIDNLGLIRYDNNTYERAGSASQIDEVLVRMLDRRYNWDGTGGLFPLSRAAQKDQRRVEIWYQMSAWVIHNYPI